MKVVYIYIPPFLFVTTPERSPAVSVDATQTVGRAIWKVKNKYIHVQTSSNNKNSMSVVHQAKVTLYHGPHLVHVYM